MTATEKQRIPRQNLWSASRRAEREGNVFQALEIHKQVLIEEQSSYAASLRAGWLYYKLGAYEEALWYYERACVLSEDAWPVYGIMNCLTALGEDDATARVARSIYETARPAMRPAHD